jgi:hypothetical protein
MFLWEISDGAWRNLGGHGTEADFGSDEKSLWVCPLVGGNEDFGL